jgi:lysine 2,3-aminomutase
LWLLNLFSIHQRKEYDGAEDSIHGSVFCRSAFSTRFYFFSIMHLEQWQIDLQNCVRTIEELERFIPITNRKHIREVIANMRLAITPHTLGLIDFHNPNDPLLLMSVPNERELILSADELDDPIGDEIHSPISFLTHRYPDRVLVHATFFCAQFCRFCFRRFKTGGATPGPAERDVDRIIEYLHDHPEVEEVILTGGDPFTLLDRQIDDWLKRLREIQSVRRIRFHTRVPVTLPSRVTDSLVGIIKARMDNTHPIYVVTHFNHPREIAPENVTAIAKLVDAGIVVRNQGPLLKGVNDNPDTLARLYKKLVDIRVVPYYLHQLDLAKGTSHFRVPIERGLTIMSALRNNITGIALPRYVLDVPGGKGKGDLCKSRDLAAYGDPATSSPWD